MPKFHLFAGDSYYPSSGLGDYRGAYDSVEELKATKFLRSWATVKTAEPEDYRSYRDFDWYCIAVLDPSGKLVEHEHGSGDTIWPKDT